MQNFNFLWNNFIFYQKYLNTSLKTQKKKIEPRFDFRWQFLPKYQTCQQNSMLRIYSKPTEFTWNRTEIDKNFQCVMALIKYPDILGYRLYVRQKSADYKKMQ